tara:strand:- start:1005 stop:1127 length:123 start_codon:yes stop_codon:yes gene_type:complete
MPTVHLMEPVNNGFYDYLRMYKERINALLPVNKQETLKNS